MTTAAVRTPLELDVWALAVATVDAGGADADSIIRAVRHMYGQPGLDVLLASLQRMMNNGKEAA